MKFYTNAKYIYIDWIEDLGLCYASNEALETWLSEFVSIINKLDADRNWDTGFKNGRKKAKVDFDKKVKILSLIHI